MLDLHTLEICFGNYTSSKQSSSVNASSILISTSSNVGIKYVLKSIVVPSICLIGVLGNILSLIILTKRQASADRMERCVGIGLLALAVSDLLFCLCLLPHAFLDKELNLYPKISFELVYRIYHQPIINTFLLTSTWLTVSMALSRYMAICQPFHCRPLIGYKATKLTVVFVYVMCIGFNLIRFMEYKINKVECKHLNYYYMRTRTFFTDSLARIYGWCYLTFAIVVPMLVLLLCNTFLVRALRTSSRLRKEYRVRNKHVDQNDRITVILIVITIFYVILVVPSEILNVAELTGKGGTYRSTISYSLTLTTEIFNALQTINSSFNFALYYLLNVHFRKAMHSLICYLPSVACPAAVGLTAGNGPPATFSQQQLTNRHNRQFLLQQRQQRQKAIGLINYNCQQQIHHQLPQQQLQHHQQQQQQHQQRNVTIETIDSPQENRENIPDSAILIPPAPTTITTAVIDAF